MLARPKLASFSLRRLLTSSTRALTTGSAGVFVLVLRSCPDGQAEKKKARVYYIGRRHGAITDRPVLVLL